MMNLANVSISSSKTHAPLIKTHAPLMALCVVGTRPEVVKMASVVKMLDASPGFQPVLVSVGQHSNLLDLAIRDFGLAVDHHLSINRSRSSLANLVALITGTLDALVEELQPDFLIAQGDTSSVLATSLVAFLRKIPFVHIEAGLRSGDLGAPFPEEYNRRVVSLGTTIHCAPTEASRDNLLGEGCAAETIVVTGNTVIDTLLRYAKQPLAPLDVAPGVKKLILVTAHRRENLGPQIVRAMEALRRFVEETPDVGILLPVHPNPAVRAGIAPLMDCERVVLTEPLPYEAMVAALRTCWLVVTDSGGLQEEGPALAKPVLVLRDSTERPEAVAAGAARLVGTDPETILETLRHLYHDTDSYGQMAQPRFIYGDGRAAHRIVDAMQRFALKNASDTNFGTPNHGAVRQA